MQYIYIGQMTNLNNVTMGSIGSLTLIIFILGIFNNASAQTGVKHNLGNEDITIIKEYQPVLNDAFKMNILPEGDTSTFAPAELRSRVW